MIGGAETYALLLARGLAENRSAGRPDGIQVTVATEAMANGFDDSSLPFLILRQPNLRKLLTLIRQSDLLQTAGPCLLPLLLAWLLRKPYVIEQHGYQAVCPNGLLLFEPTKSVCPGHFMARHHTKCWQCNRAAGIRQSLRMWLVTFVRRWFCKQAAANVAVSQHVRQRLQLSNSVVIYHGISAQRVDPRTDTYRLSTPLGFAYVGRLVSEKGLDALLDAAAALNHEGIDFRLKLIGDGPERAHLEQLATARSLNSHVVFTGFVTGEGLRWALDDVSVVVMPSRWEETAGLSAIEHMMRGRLVICSDIGGLSEVVGDAGLKFAIGDTRGLTARMREVATCPQIVEEFGRKARQRALQFFVQDRMIREHAELYGSVTTRKWLEGKTAPELR